MASPLRKLGSLPVRLTRSTRLSRSSQAALGRAYSILATAIFDNDNVAERFTVGVKGDKLFNGTWGYDGAFMYSQITQYSTVHS